MVHPFKQAREERLAELLYLLGSRRVNRRDIMSHFDISGPAATRMIRDLKDRGHRITAIRDRNRFYYHYEPQETEERQVRCVVYMRA